MGSLIDGTWQPASISPSTALRASSQPVTPWRGVITADGRPGPDGRRFAAQAGRYHLIVSFACPWAHRTLLARCLCGLEDIVSCDVVEAVMGDDGWAFAGHSEPGPAGATADRLFGCSYLRDIYLAADAHCTGRVSVPVLWDKVQQTIVSNESADIVAMFDGAFAAVGGRCQVLRPARLQGAIDATNKVLQTGINVGVYRCGFADSQATYDRAVAALFAALDAVEEQLAHCPYLHGEAPTESDWRLWVTLARFDAVYVGHFRCNRQRIADYTQLSRYVRALHRLPKVAATLRIDHIKHHYFRSHKALNPSGIVPVGPANLFG